MIQINKPSLQITFGTKSPNKNYYEVKQTHSNKIASLFDIKANQKSLLEADGICWKSNELKKGESIAIKTADCLSILLLGKNKNYLVHAGWRGVHLGIICNINTTEIREAIFLPSILDCCYEVQPDFSKYFPGSSFFYKRKGNVFFNLQKEAAFRIGNSNPRIKIEAFNDCTCCSENRLHSFRRDKTTSRNYTLVTKV